MKLLKLKSEAQEVEAKEQNSLLDTDDKTYSRIGWMVVALGVGGFLLWASFAPLDKGVPVTGTVMVASNRQAVQHQTGGTIEQILVKEGDAVKKGQPLIRMNEVAVRSNADTARAQYYTARAAEARLVAERDGKATLVFPQQLLSLGADPRVASIIAVQQQLFATRRSAIQMELSAIDESISGLKSQLAGLQESLANQKLQAQYLKEQLEGMRDLAKEGYVSRNRLLDLERTYAQVNGGISENVGNIGRTQRQISELGLRRSQRQQEYQKEVRTQLQETQKEAEALESRLKSLDFDIQNAVVKAPVDGTVVGLSVFTSGGVIPPGFKMMDIVPNDEPLVVEGMVPTNLIDKVHKDLPVELIFAALNLNETPHVPGIVTQVSADRFTDEHTGMPYYKIKAKATPEGMRLLKRHQIRPGMPVEVFVKTGERTMMSYLLKPLVDRAKTSLTEE